MTRQNWHWDISLPETKIREILTREDDPRFPRIAGVVMSRVEDPKEVFKLITPLAFCRRWRAIEREIKSDEWTKEKAAFWKSTYIKLSKELRNKGEKIRKTEKIPLDSFTRDVIVQIRKTRKRALMSQKELAEFMGCSQQYISGIEKGRERVSLEFLKKFASITNEPIGNFPWKFVMDAPQQPTLSESQTPRQKRIDENLALIGPGLATFYKDACHLMTQGKFDTQTHLVSHCLREIESGMRAVLIKMVKAKPPNETQKKKSQNKDDNQKREILDILTELEVPLGSSIAQAWIALAGTLHARAHREALGPPRPVDDTFLNVWNDVEHMLDAMLVRFREKFLDQTRFLDDLLSKDHPTQSDLDALKNDIANNPVTFRYFFTRCQEEWLDLLKEGGFFERPPSIERNQEDGTIRVPPWPQSSYLARMAAVQPRKVSEVIREIRTDNASIHENLVDAALAMPAEYSVQWVEQEITWISKQANLGFLLPEKFGLLTAHLARGGQGEVALELAGAFLRVFPDSERMSDARRFSLPPEPKALFDAWHYEKVVTENVPDLVKGVGFPTLTLMCDLLKNAIRLSRKSETGGPEDHSYAWRQSIGHGGLGNSHGFKNVLVSGVRDAAKLLVETEISKIDEIVQFLEEQPWKVFRRVALHLLALFPGRAPDLVATHLTDYSLFDDRAIGCEYPRLLARGFVMLQPEQQQTILDWIKKGPDLERFKKSEERFVGKRPTDEEAKQYSKYWQRDRLAWFKNQLPEDWKSRYESLVAELGEPKHPDLPFHVEVGWTGPTSPKGADELSRMSVPELVYFLRTWRSEKGWMVPSPEGLGRVLSDVVKGEPERFSREALSFKIVRPTYVRSFISGITDALKEKRKIAWAPIFELCKWIVEQPADISEELRGVSKNSDAGSDADWSGTRSAIARLVSEALQGEHASFDQRRIVWEILAPLTADPDPTPEHEAKYGGSNMDPSTLSINTTRGEAMHAVIRYASWVRRQLEQGPEAEEKLARGFDEMLEVKSVLEAHLDTEKDPSLAIRSIYGQWLPRLILIDSQWVRDNLETIFPSQKSMRSYYDAVWEAYVAFCDVYDNTFPMLRKQYETAVKSLRGDRKDKNEHGDPGSHVVEHVMVLYGRGLFRLGDPKSIFSTFWECAPDKLRTYAIEFIGRSLYDTKDQVPPAMLHRLRALWESRLSIAKREADVTAHGELRAFGWWFASGKFDDEWAVSQLYEVIKITGSIDPDHWVVERLAKLAAHMPEECVKCLELIVIHESTGWGIYSWREAAKAILGKALHTEAAAQAKRVINYLGSKGHLEFGELLQTA